MVEVEDAHGFRERFQKAKQRLRERDLSERTKEVIEEFVRHLRLEGLSRATYTTYFEILQRSASFFDKALSEVEVCDVRDLMLSLEDRSYSHGYVRNHRKVYKKLLRFLDRDVSDFTVGASSSNNKGPENIIKKK